MVTTLISPIISSICGGLFGGIQGCIERNQDSKKEIELAKIQAEKEIAIASQQSIISQNQAGTQKDITEQEKSKTEASVRQSDVIEYQAFANAATQTSAIWNSQSMLANIANFIIATTRPNITYLLIGLCGVPLKNNIYKNFSFQKKSKY